MCTEQGGSHRMPPCDRPRPGVDITRGGGGDASESARGDSALLGTRKRSKFPFASRKKNAAVSGRSSVFFASLSLRLVEPSAPGSLLAARSGRSDSRTRLPIHSAPCGTGRRTQRRHGVGLCDGGGQTGRGRARRRARRLRKEHDVSIVLSFMNDEHEKVAIEVRRGKRRRMRARALDEPSGFLRVAALRPAREIRLSIWNSTRLERGRVVVNDSRLHVASFAATFDFRDVRRSSRSSRARLTDTSRDSPSTRPTRYFLRAM